MEFEREFISPLFFIHYAILELQGMYISLTSIALHSEFVHQEETRAYFRGCTIGPRYKPAKHKVEIAVFWMFSTNEPGVRDLYQNPGNTYWKPPQRSPFSVSGTCALMHHVVSHALKLYVCVPTPTRVFDALGWVSRPFTMT